MTMKDIPTRKAPTTTEPEAKQEAPKKTLAGKFRVREGYLIPHGAFDASGSRAQAKGGDVIHLTHEEAISLIKLTMHQKDNDGKPNGPCIETEAAYNTRIEAQRAAEEFARVINEYNPLLDLTTATP